MHFEENDVTESDKPKKGLKFLLGLCAAMGIITFFLMFVPLSKFSNVDFTRKKTIAHILVLVSVFCASVFISVGSIRMFTGIKKGWGQLFTGCSVFFFFVAMCIFPELPKLFRSSERRFLHVSNLLGFLTLLAVLLLSCYTAIVLLSPGIRKFVSSKKLLPFFLVIAVLIALVLIGFIIDKRYFRYSIH